MPSFLISVSLYGKTFSVTTNESKGRVEIDQSHAWKSSKFLSLYFAPKRSETVTDNQTRSDILQGQALIRGVKKLLTRGVC